MLQDPLPPPFQQPHGCCTLVGSLHDRPVDMHMHMQHTHSSTSGKHRRGQSAKILHPSLRPHKGTGHSASNLCCKGQQACNSSMSPQVNTTAVDMHAIKVSQAVLPLMPLATTQPLDHIHLVCWQPDGRCCSYAGWLCRAVVVLHRAAQSYELYTNWTACHKLDC
jgi:hypothetical protein